MAGQLNRLSRNAEFLLALRDRAVQFVAVDKTEANGLALGIMALECQSREATCGALRTHLGWQRLGG